MSPTTKFLFESFTRRFHKVKTVLDAMYELINEEMRSNFRLNMLEGFKRMQRTIKFGGEIEESFSESACEVIIQRRKEKSFDETCGR